jgi:hypothetical protein
MANTNGLQKAMNAARFANGAKNIIMGGMKGGLHGAAIAAAKSFAPQMIKIAVIAIVVLLLLPIIVISALPSVLFGWGTVPAQDLRDRKTYAEMMEPHYDQVAAYRADIIDEIKESYAENGAIVTVIDNNTDVDVYWWIAIDGARTQQDVYKLNAATIKQLIRDSLTVQEDWQTDGEVVVVTLTITTCTPEELMNKLDFENDRKNWARLMYNTTTSAQVVSETGEDYINGIGESYGGVTYRSGATDVVYYSQLDGRWANTLYGRAGTIGKEGCGPASLAIVVSTLTNRTVTPVDTANWSAANGHRCVGSGSYHTLIPKGSEHYGLSVTSAGKNERQKIIDALSGGSLIVALMNPGAFTTTGHFIVLRGVTDTGKILVADPVSVKRTEQEWDLSLILNQARWDSSACGPLWVISIPG